MNEKPPTFPAIKLKEDRMVSVNVTGPRPKQLVLLVSFPEKSLVKEQKLVLLHQQQQTTKQKQIILFTIFVRFIHYDDIICWWFRSGKGNKLCNQFSSTTILWVEKHAGTTPYADEVECRDDKWSFQNQGAKCQSQRDDVIQANAVVNQTD